MCHSVIANGKPHTSVTRQTEGPRSWHQPIDVQRLRKEPDDQVSTTASPQPNITQELSPSSLPIAHTRSLTQLLLLGVSSSA